MDTTQQTTKRPFNTMENIKLLGDIAKAYNMKREDSEALHDLYFKMSRK